MRGNFRAKRVHCRYYRAFADQPPTGRSATELSAADIMHRDSYSDSCFVVDSSDALQTEPVAPASPCVSVCTLDEDKVCKGCRRTIDEIVAWPRMSAADQAQLLVELARRES